MKPCAVAIVFDSQRKKVLLHKRQDIPVWVLPGGGIDSGETAETAAVREVYEETGLRVTIHRKVAEYTPLNRLTRPTYSFECQVVEGELALGQETSDVAFFSLTDLPATIFPLHVDWIDDAWRGGSEVIKSDIHQITYWTLVKEVVRHPWMVLRYFYTRFTMDRPKKSEKK